MKNTNRHKPVFEEKPLSEVSILPEGWAETSLDQILLSLESGSRPKGGVRGIIEGVPSVGGEHLNENGGFRFEAIKFVPYEFFERMNRGRIKKGDILVVKDGATTGKVALIRSDFPYDPAVVNEHVFICRPVVEVHPPFLFYFLFSKEGQDRILANFRGSAQGGINQSFAPGTIVPFAPLPEQKRIVAKVEELLARVNVVRERLARVKEILKRFRQSVLSAACSGRLTEDWRERNGNADRVEEFLKKIEQERKKKGLRKENLFVQDSDEFPPSWIKANLSFFIESMVNGIYKPGKFYSDHGVVCLRMYNIQNGKIVWSNLKRMALSPQEIDKYRLNFGDILINRVNSRELVGKAAFIEEPDEPTIFESKNIRLRLLEKDVMPRFVNYCLSTRTARDVFEMDAKQTVGMATISQPQIANLLLPIPPLGEQEEIVRRVEALFNLVYEIERRVIAATERAEKITQAILCKAFRGELVPTEAELAQREGHSYEPAGQLLEKIRRQSRKSKTKRRYPRDNKKR